MWVLRLSCGVGSVQLRRSSRSRGSDIFRSFRLLAVELQGFCTVIALSIIARPLSYSSTSLSFALPDRGSLRMRRLLSTVHLLQLVCDRCVIYALNSLGVCPPELDLSAGSSEILQGVVKVEACSASEASILIIRTQREADDMGNERTIREILNTPSQRRRRLSNITNLSLSANWSSISREDSLLKSCSKSNDSQLQKENMALRKSLAEKEDALEELARRFEELQKDHRRLSQVNVEIISFNTRLSKNRLLNHEFKQLTFAYKTQISELQLKLEETQDQLKRLREERECTEPLRLRRARSQMYRRHSTSGRILVETDWGGSSSTKVTPQSPAAEESVSRAGVRRRSGRFVLPKEIASEVDTNPEPVPGSIRHINKKSDLIGLEPMEEIPGEETSPRNSSSGTSTSSNSLGDSSSKGRLISEPKRSRTDEPTASSATSRSTDPSGPSGRGRSQPNKASKLNLVPPEPQKLATSSSDPHFSRRAKIPQVSGTGRPVRRAVENVSTYREPPLNTKMRRAT
ncbi:hypothetical protein R1sor_015072 [Riccia sorocarpa]|uniref:Shugoshin C-terminal domain-containing protein n=1 Tax=Riccia sorocarpa TaxID=122646 RepID=A0ABD3HBM3_9MARC